MALKSSRNDAAAASGLAEDVGQNLNLLGTVVLRIPERVEMHVDETEECAWCDWGDDVHIKRIPPIITREYYAGGASEFSPSLDPIAFLLPRIQAGGKALLGQQRHGHEGYALKQRLVLGVSR